MNYPHNYSYLTNLVLLLGGRNEFWPKVWASSPRSFIPEIRKKINQNLEELVKWETTCILLNLCIGTWQGSQKIRFYDAEKFDVSSLSWIRQWPKQPSLCIQCALWWETLTQVCMYICIVLTMCSRKTCPPARSKVTLTKIASPKKWVPLTTKNTFNQGVLKWIAMRPQTHRIFAFHDHQLDGHKRHPSIYPAIDQCASGS